MHSHAGKAVTGRMDEQDRGDIYQESLKLHEEHRGKIEIRPKVPLETRHDLAMAYTPGVAEVCRAIHAEQNCIIQASLHGVSLEGATIYCTHTPCILCAKMLANSRIKRFVSFGKYADDSFVELFAEAGITTDILEEPSAEITHLE